MRKLKRNREVKKTFEAVSPSSLGRSREIVDWAIDFIEDELPEWEGQTVYGSDLANTITEVVNRNGSYEEDSLGFISNHFYDASDEYDYEKGLGEVPLNPFENPDAFVVRMLVNIVDSILSKVPFIQEHWNGALELTKENINTILKALK